MPSNQDQAEAMQRMRGYYTTHLQSLTQNPARAFQLLSHQPDGPSPRFNVQTLRQLIVMDASFNPPTSAHVDMLRSACLSRAKEKQHLGCLLLLSVKNADKGIEPAPLEDRLGMMRAMADDLWHDEKEASRIPVYVGITTEPYFHDKFEAIRASIQEQGGGEAPKITFLAGFDTLIRVFNPKYYTNMRQALDPFFERAELRITLRPDPQWGTVDEQRTWVGDLKKQGKLEAMGGREEWLNKVEVVEGGEEGEGVSSSRVRRMIAQKEGGWERLVARGVDGYVKREGLYV